MWSISNLRLHSGSFPQFDSDFTFSAFLISHSMLKVKTVAKKAIIVQCRSLDPERFEIIESDLEYLEFTWRRKAYEN